MSETINPALPIKREAYPLIYKVLSDAEMLLTELTGFGVKLEMKAPEGGILTKNEANKIRLQMLICSSFTIPWVNVAGKSRRRPIVNARKAYTFLAIKVLGQTTIETAKDLHRDHTSIMHLRDACEDHIRLNDPIAPIIETIKNKLYEKV